jgi:hypothetical protein
MIIHPTYDPSTRVWFVEGHPQEAKTIRDLLAKFPKSCRVLDYYPNGFAVRWSGRPYLAATTEQPKINLPRHDPPKPVKQTAAQKSGPGDQWPTLRPVGPQKTPWTTEQYEQALDMWAGGISGKIIGEKIGLPRVVVSSRMMEVARARKDPRAVSRRKPYARSSPLSTGWR